MEKISVIIPVYNAEKYLDRCMDSVLKQTYTNLEIFLVDDGATDNSGKMCDEYAKKDNRIKVIHKKNGGLSDARNAALAEVTGEYIGFVDSDDYIADDMFETLYNLVKKYNAEISVAAYYEIRKGKIIDVQDSGQLNLYSREEAIIELLRDTKIQSYAWNKLYKRELFENIKYPKGKHFEDIATTILLFEKANKVVRLEKPVYYYVRRDDSITENRNYKTYKDYIDVVFNKYLYLFDKYGKDVEEYNAYSFVTSMIWFYSLANAYDLVELQKEFDNIYPFFITLVEKSKKIIDTEMNLFNKTLLNMMMLDKDGTKAAIKEFYLSQRIKRENGESNLQI